MTDLGFSFLAASLIKPFHICLLFIRTAVFISVWIQEKKNQTIALECYSTIIILWHFSSVNFFMWAPLLLIGKTDIATSFPKITKWARVWSQHNCLICLGLVYCFYTEHSSCLKQRKISRRGYTLRFCLF